MVVRDARSGDAARVAEIFNHYVLRTCATFEVDPVSVADMAARMAEVQKANLPWLVAEQSEGLVGYAYASKWKPRFGYRFCVESTIYLDPERRGNGIGRKLYAMLLDTLWSRDIHAVIGGITLPNDVSIALHERLGFYKAGHLEQVGFKHGKRIDVGLWQLLRPGAGGL